MIATGQIKMIFRSWGRNRLNTVISFTSLTVGLTCSILLILFVMNEYKIATALQSSQDVYVVQCIQKYNESESQPSLSIRYGYWKMLTERFPAIVSSCSCFDPLRSRIQTEDKIFPSDNLYDVESTFADYFNLPMVSGNLKKTLSAPDEVAITQSYASKWLNGKNPIGTPLTIHIERFINSSDPTHEAVETRFVTAVIDDSRSGIFNIDVLIGLSDPMAYEESPWGGPNYRYIQLAPGASAEELVAAVNSDSTLRTSFPDYSISLEPFQQFYFTNQTDTHLYHQRDSMLLYIGLCTALLILLIACFNYINLMLTSANQRLRNMAGQRIMGASKGSVRWQIIFETLFQIMCCCMLALYLIYILLPLFNAFMQCEIHFTDVFTVDTFGLILMLLTAVTLLPSCYILSRLQTDSLLTFVKKGHVSRSHLVQGMVIAQFAISTVLIIVSLNIYRQIHFITAQQPYADHIILYHTPFMNDGTPDQISEFNNRIRNLPSIEQVLNQSLINRSTYISTVNGERSTQTANMSVTLDYFDFMGIPLRVGRLFTEKDDPKNIIINQAMADLYHLEDPIGQQLNLPDGPYTVIGMIPDVPFDNLHKKVLPAFYTRELNNIHHSITIKTLPGQVEQVNEALNNLWNEISHKTGTQFIPQTLEEELRSLHANDFRIQKMVLTFTGISILLTVMGLFGLAWYSVERRRKEIALRKVHGATVGEVVRLLCSGFIQWMCWSVVIALPFAYYFSWLWFRDFAYKVDMGVTVFVFATLLVLTIGSGTVLYQSWSAARRNPIKAIKTE